MIERTGTNRGTSKPLSEILEQVESLCKHLMTQQQYEDVMKQMAALKLTDDVPREAAEAAIAKVIEEAARIVRLEPGVSKSEARKELARQIYKVSHIFGNFTLRSGQISNEYFDKYLFTADPKLLAEIADQMAKLIPPGTEVLAGLEMGAIPLATALSLKTGLPAAFVRKKAKEYGTAKFAEGAEVRDKQVLIIEDVVTTGGQIVLSANDLKTLGARIHYVLCVIERDKKAEEILGKEGLELRALFTMEELTASQK